MSPSRIILFFLVTVGTVVAVSPPGCAQFAGGDSVLTFSQYLDSAKTGSSGEVVVGAYYAELPLDTARSQSPTVALFKSLFVPGWGQLSNRKYIKAVIFISLEGLFAANIIHYAKKASDARKVWLAAYGDTTGDIIGPLYTKYRSAKDDRNLYSWLLGTTVFISMFDAYVDAHLARFPKPEKRLSFMFGPDPEYGTLATLSFKF